MVDFWGGGGGKGRGGSVRIGGVFRLKSPVVDNSFNMEFFFRPITRRKIFSMKISVWLLIVKFKLSVSKKHLYFKYLKAQSELRASPLKPNVSTLARSEKSLSLDVWCFKVKASKLCGSTSKMSAPWFLSLMSIFVAPASKLFSTSSFIAVAILNITCPEHIWWIVRLSIAWTTGDEAPAILPASEQRGFHRKGPRISVSFPWNL